MKSVGHYIFVPAKRVILVNKPGLGPFTLNEAIEGMQDMLFIKGIYNRLSLKECPILDIDLAL